MTSLVVIVNESPWGSGLALTAWRFLQAAAQAGVTVPAVFFREDGVYNALAGEAHDGGTPQLCAAWSELSRSGGVRLLLCSSSRQRRLPGPADAPWQDSGLTELMELVLDCDRVVTF